jgi:[acyl-carrier-protein] S-malonyltransferase
VISGSRTACQRATELAGEFACRAVSLPVAGAFHSPLMEPAAEGLQSTLEQAHFAEPMLPVVANVDCEYHTDPLSIRDSLKRQLTKPVLWQRCIERMIEDGVDCFVEMGPGRVLTGLMRKINRKMTAVSVRDAASIAGVVAQPSAS